MQNSRVISKFDYLSAGPKCEFRNGKLRALTPSEMELEYELEPYCSGNGAVTAFRNFYKYNSHKIGYILRDYIDSSNRWYNMLEECFGFGFSQARLLYSEFYKREFGKCRRERNFPQPDVTSDIDVHILLKAKEAFGKMFGTLFVDNPDLFELKSDLLALFKIGFDAGKKKIMGIVNSFLSGVRVIRIIRRPGKRTYTVASAEPSPQYVNIEDFVGIYE